MEKLSNYAPVSYLNQKKTSPIDQLRLVVQQALDKALTFEPILKCIVQLFDVLDGIQKSHSTSMPVDLQEALVLLIMSQKQEGDVALSLQDILIVLSAIKTHPHASKETIAAITHYQVKCELDRLLENGMEQYNQAREGNPIWLKIDWVEVVTHEAADQGAVLSNIARHFEAINRNAENSSFRPSDNLLEVCLAFAFFPQASGEISSPTLVFAIASLEHYSQATPEMKSILADYLEVFISYIKSVTVEEILALPQAGKKFLSDPCMRPFLRRELHRTTLLFLSDEDNSNWLNTHRDQLAKLLGRSRQPLEVAKFFTLSSHGQQLLCEETKMYSLIKSQRISLDKFLALDEESQKRLDEHWDVLKPLLEAGWPRGGDSAFERVVRAIQNESCYTALSDEEVKQLILDRPWAIEELFALTDSDRNRLCTNDGIKAFLTVSTAITIFQFFSWPTLKQHFIESNWPLLLSKVNDQKLTWEQIKKTTAVDLTMFETQGLDAYLEQVNDKYPSSEDCIIS